MRTLSAIMDGSKKYEKLPLADWRDFHKDCPVCPRSELATSTPVRHECHVAGAISDANFGRLPTIIMQRLATALADDGDDQDVGPADDMSDADQGKTGDVYEKTMRELERERQQSEAERELNIDRRVRNALADAAKLCFTAKLDRRTEIVGEIEAGVNALQAALEVNKSGTPAVLQALSKLEGEIGYKALASELIGGTGPAGDSLPPML
jgi:hypothetical protein